MLRKKTKKASNKATRVIVKKEMAKPSMARSARIAERKLDTRRIPERPSVTLLGTVDKIIPSPDDGRPGKVQIAIEGKVLGHLEFMIENALTDENGDDVKLEKADRVEVTVTAESKTFRRIEGQLPRY